MRMLALDIGHSINKRDRRLTDAAGKLWANEVASDIPGETPEARLTDKDEVIADLREQCDYVQQRLAAAQERLAALLADQRQRPYRPGVRPAACQCRARSAVA